MTTKVKLAALGLAAAAVLPLAACTSQADTASYNLSKDADQFKIERQIVFYNGITGSYIAEVTGLCSIGNDNTAAQMSYTCKVGPNRYIKNFLHVSANVTWFALQSKPAPSNPYHYEVLLRPSEIIPSFKVDG